MKIRNGFVSNSSSSSFLIILTEEQYKNLLNTLDEYQKEVLDNLSENKEVLGQSAVIISGVTGNYSCFDDMDVKAANDLDDEQFFDKFGYEKFPAEAFYQIKWPENIFSYSVDS